MTLFKGANFLLKILHNDKYITLGGMQTTRFVLNNQLIDVTTKDSAGWRELLACAGTAHLSVSASGIYTNSESEQLLTSLAFNNQIHNFKLAFGNDEQIEGRFQISSYERHGGTSGEEQYSISLESASRITFV